MSAVPAETRLEILGTMAGGIAHDFNSMLVPIIGYGELAQQYARDGTPLRRYLDNIMLAASLARELADRVLAFSRSKPATLAPIAVQGLVAGALELIEVSLPTNIRLEKVFLASDTTVVGNEAQLHQIVMNLCGNAAHAMPRGGVLQVRLERSRVAATCTCSRGGLSVGDYVCLAVSDSGTGMAPQILEQIFEPFFTTRPPGEGTGLGLSLVDRIVADCGGAIEVSSVVGGGTTFHVWLPATAESRPA